MPRRRRIEDELTILRELKGDPGMKRMTKAFRDLDKTLNDIDGTTINLNINL